MLVVRLVWYFDVDPPPKRKQKCRKTSTTNNSSRSLSRSHSSYGINVGFINFLICKFLMLIARALHGNLSFGCVWVCVYVLCIKEWQQHAHGTKRVLVQTAVLKPFFFVCDQKDCVTHNTKKCLKFIWSLPPHINFYVHARYFLLQAHTQFHLFWYSMFLFSFSNEEKNPFHSKRNSRWYIFWDGCDGKNGMETTYNNNKPPTA